MVFYLQSRWKLRDQKLVYYGLRRADKLFRNEYKLSPTCREIIGSLPRELSAEEMTILGPVMGDAVVSKPELRNVPQSLSEARFCTRCAANDFIIPGLEFDETGLCPLCATEDRVKGLKSLVPLMEDIPRSNRSRFDVALFYTGGKDSTFLLHYLANVKGLRVLALTWEIPFMSESAKKSMENARKCFENVEFISRSVSRGELRRIYAKLYELSENTCACPSIAYVLFYPELVENRVPYFLAGNEPAQILGLYYNHMAPEIAYRFPDMKLLHGLINLGRILTLRPPLKRGQFHTLATMKQLAYGDSFFKRAAGYSDELVSNIVCAIHTVPEFVEPLRRAIRRSSRSGNIPAFVHLDFDAISGGRYDWREVKETIARECGWVPPEEDAKALHTSCSIEKCKEYSQFVRFYNCRSRMIPFSALELAIASRGRNLSREEAVFEMENLLGLSLEAPAECALMHDFLEGGK